MCETVIKLLNISIPTSTYPTRNPAPLAVRLILERPDLQKPVS